MFGSMFETYEVTIEVHIGNKLANKQSMQAPKEILMMNFIQMTEQIGRDKRPMKITMIRTEPFWDNIDKKQKVFNHEVSFSNNAMIAYEESK